MYTKKAHIHFVGIGGVGMSGIAKILAHQGYSISGCDIDHEQKSIRELQSLGCTIYQGNNTIQCHSESVEILVYSSAIVPTNPEILAAQQRGIPTIPRAVMLAELMRTKYSIAIAGAHGKTTTTSLIAHILLEAHYDPTVIIGGHLHSISTNARLGAGDFLVAEADESDRSLTRLHPTLAVITNIDAEHLDTYRDLDDIKDTFLQFINNIPFYGKAIMCYDDPHVRSLLPLKFTKAVTYGLSPESDISAHDLIVEAQHSSATVFHKRHGVLGSITLNIPGKHNIQNALAALTLSRELNIEFSVIAHAISTFKGVDRRFTFKGIYNGAEIFDDYGHHPTELRVTLEVARRRAQHNLIVVFQPHRFTRTYHLWNDFISVLSSPIIDTLIITDIYPANESPIEGINSMQLVQNLRTYAPHLNVFYIPYDDDQKALQESVTCHVQEKDLILLLGAGKVNKLAEKLIRQT